MPKKPKLNLYAVVLNNTLMVYAPSERRAKDLAKKVMAEDYGNLHVAGVREIPDEEAQELPKLLRYQYAYVDFDLVKPPLFTDDETSEYCEATVDHVTKYRLKQAKKATK